MSAQTFLSPVSKLLPFFYKSRNEWKAKCKQAKQDVKSLKIRLAKMKASRDRWKEQALQSAAARETGSAESSDSATISPATARRAGLSRHRQSRKLSAAGATGGR